MIFTSDIYFLKKFFFFLPGHRKFWFVDAHNLTVMLFWVNKITWNIPSRIHICVIIAKSISWTFTLFSKSNWLPIIFLTFIIISLRIKHGKFTLIVNLTFCASMCMIPRTPAGLIVRSFVHIVLDSLSGDYLVDLVVDQIFFIKVDACNFVTFSSSWVSATCHIRIAVDRIGLKHLIQSRMLQLIMFFVDN